MGFGLPLLLGCWFQFLSGVATAQDAKTPVPDEAARTEAAKAIQGLFKAEYSKKDPERLTALARKLLEQAEGSRDEAASCFALLDEARSLSAKAGDAVSAFRAIDRLEEYFDLEAARGLDSAVEMKADALALVQRAARTPDAVRAVAKSYSLLARQAARAGDFKIARDAAKKASSLARKVRDRALAEQNASFSKELSSLESEYAVVAKADLGKAIDIGDHRTNLNVGRYLCFARGEWEKGMEYLAWSGVDDLAAAAKKELGNPQESAPRFDVASAWDELAKGERDPLHKGRYVSRARTWYVRALEGAEGLVKIRIEKRLGELEKSLVEEIGPMITEGQALSLARLIPRMTETDWARLGGREVVVHAKYSGNKDVDVLLPGERIMLVPCPTDLWTTRVGALKDADYRGHPDSVGFTPGRKPFMRLCYSVDGGRLVGLTEGFIVAGPGRLRLDPSDVEGGGTERNNKGSIRVKIIGIK